MKPVSSRFSTEGLTYDDVLIVPAYSEVLPREEDIDIATRFTRDIELNIPIASAAMDTVTGSALAIAIAQEGGIGCFDLRIPNREEQASYGFTHTSRGELFQAIGLLRSTTSESERNEHMYLIYLILSVESYAEC